MPIKLFFDLIQRSNVGMRETIRAVSACFISDRKFQRRFLHLEFIQDKSSSNLAESIKKVAEMYNIGSFELACDGASTNHSAADKLDLRQHTCWSHSTHNIISAAYTSMGTKYAAFKRFTTVFERLLTKASRKHINSKLMNVEGYVKIPQLVATRWLSRYECIKSVLRNWDIINQNRNLLGLTQSEWNTFDNKALFEDMFEITGLGATCLLRFEVQKFTTAHKVIPTLVKWHQKLYTFRLYSKKTELGRLLAEEMSESIDTYTFGKEGRLIRPRINATAIIQASLAPETVYLQKQRKKINEIPSPELIKINEEIETRFKKINSMVMPQLKSAFT